MICSAGTAGGASGSGRLLSRITGGWFGAGFIGPVLSCATAEEPPASSTLNPRASITNRRRVVRETFISRNNLIFGELDAYSRAKSGPGPPSELASSTLNPRASITNRRRVVRETFISRNNLIFGELDAYSRAKSGPTPPSGVRLSA